MATPPLPEGVMYVRSSRTLFAIGRINSGEAGVCR